jgi:ABC-type uncharacterized transport system permease subunit
MIDRLSLLCFGGTYALALMAELSRFAVRSAWRWHLTLGLTALGWVVQTAYLVNLGAHRGGLPISTVFQSLVALAWILAAIDLYLMSRAPRTAAVGSFVLPVVIALVVIAGLMPNQARLDWTRLGGWKTLWGSLHGILLILGAVFTCVAFASGLMYLAQSNRLKHRRPARFGFNLPSLEQSERWNRWAINLAFPLLTAGLLIGLGLNLETQREGAGVMRWSDPKVLSTAALWLLFAGLLHARYRADWQGSRVMVLTVVAFGFMLFAWVGVDLLFPTDHGVSHAMAVGSGEARP